MALCLDGQKKTSHVAATNAESPVLQAWEQSSTFNQAKGGIWGCPGWYPSLHLSFRVQGLWRSSWNKSKRTAERNYREPLQGNMLNFSLEKIFLKKFSYCICRDFEISALIDFVLMYLRTQSTWTTAQNHAGSAFFHWYMFVLLLILDKISATWSFFRSWDGCCLLRHERCLHPSRTRIICSIFGGKHSTLSFDYPTSECPDPANLLHQIYLLESSVCVFGVCLNASQVWSMNPMRSCTSIWTKKGHGSVRNVPGEFANDLEIDLLHMQLYNPSDWFIVRPVHSEFHFSGMHFFW